MILQRLVEYYDRLASDAADPMTPHGFSRESIGFALLIEPDGTKPELIDLRNIQGKKQFPRTMTVPDRGGRSGTALKRNFLWDNSGYVLGKDSKGNPNRTTQAFESFRDLHVEMASSIDDEGLAAVARFLSTWKPASADLFSLLPEALDKNIVFRIRGVAGFVHDSPNIRSGWTRRPTNDDDEVVIGQSLISGDSGPLARLHPMISGVTGAQTMGAAIASFNSKAYESYGKVQTFNSPVSVADAFKYTTALNRLLEGRSHRFGIGDATVVFWADQPTPFEQFASEILADVPGPSSDAPAEDKLRAEQIRRIRSQLREGHTSDEAIKDDKVRFYIAGFSPNASRISVRFWIDSTVGEMKARLAQHMADTEMTGARDDDPPLMIRRIVAATGRAELDRGRFKGYDAGAVSPLLAGAIARAVLTGGPYPPSLLATLINRIKADGSIRHERVAAIKAVIVRNSRIQKQPKEVPVALDPDRTDPAYVTGRLFALLEKIQTDSLGGDLNATIKDRYFSAASATPGLVFPRLNRLSQHHLAKLKKHRRFIYERLLREAVGKLQSFASHLMLEEQGMFAVGYFHQHEALFIPKKEEPETV